MLEAFFTGLDAQQAAVSVPAGAVIRQDFNLTSAARYGADATSSVKLDPLVVATSRETDGAVIALSEQRFAPNIKNVVATDAMGDVMDGKMAANDAVDQGAQLWTTMKEKFEKDKR